VSEQTGLSWDGEFRSPHRCTILSATSTVLSRCQFAVVGIWHVRVCSNGTRRVVPAHAAVYNTFDVQRHLISRTTLRQFRGAAMSEWQIATCAA
jgi:hypothetical protein